jgi:hypothetical protein
MHRNLQRVFDASRGELIACCEGDDYWVDSSKVQRQADLLCARPDLSAVFTDFVVSRFERGRWVVASRSALSGVDLSHLRGNLRGKSLAGQLRTLTAMYRSNVLRTLYERGLPQEDYPFTDSFLLAQALSCGAVWCMEFVSAVYRQSPNSATRSSPSSNLKVLLALRRFLEKLEEYFPKLGPIDASEFHNLDVAICRAAFVAGAVDEYAHAYTRLRGSGTRTPRYLSWLRPILKQPSLRTWSVRLRSLLRRGLR